MNQIYVDQGLQQLLGRLITPSFKYRLFINNLTPNRGTVLGDMTPATFTGSDPIIVAAGDFSIGTTVGHVGTRIAPPIAFTNGSGGDTSAYGYYVTDADDTNLLFAARFDAAPVTKADGESFIVIPIIGDFSQLAA